MKLRESLGEPLAEPENLKVLISDLYPNLKEFKKVKERYPDAIDYFPQPVNALNPPAQAPRVRTILSALHHFRPDEVRAILRDAAENADGIAAFEATGRTWFNLVMTLPLPLMAAVITVFMLRPFRLRHLIWGLLIPVIPLTALFDGIVSNLRTSTPCRSSGSSHDRLTSRGSNGRSGNGGHAANPPQGDLLVWLADHPVTRRRHPLPG